MYPRDSYLASWSHAAESGTVPIAPAGTALSRKTRGGKLCNFIARAAGGRTCRSPDSGSGRAVGRHQLKMRREEEKMKMVRRQFLHFAGAATAFFAPPYVVRAQAQAPRIGAPLRRLRRAVHAPAQ